MSAAESSELSARQNLRLSRHPVEQVDVFHMAQGILVPGLAGPVPDFLFLLTKLPHDLSVRDDAIHRQPTVSNHARFVLR